MKSSENQRIAIIGGGVSGLAAAMRLSERLPTAAITILERDSRLGGIIQSTKMEGFLLEHAADSFIVSPELPWAGALCERLGLPLIETNVQRRGAMIVRGGHLYPVPEGLQLMAIHRWWRLITSPLLSWRGKFRVLGERFVRAGLPDQEESLAQFAKRRYGREMFEQIIQPLVSGIYTADPNRLSMQAALPQFVQQEQKHGSLWKAAKHSPRHRESQGARYGLFRSPVDGMQTMIDALENQLLTHGATILRESKVAAIQRIGTQWEVSGVQQAQQPFDGVVLATSAKAVPQLLQEVPCPAASLAEQIEHVSTAVVCLGVREQQLKNEFTSFGCVVPYVEGRKILAISCTNNKFPDRAPSGHILLRVFVGGALQSELLNQSDQDLVAMVLDELHQLLGLSGEPVLTKVVRWPHTTPQYNMGHQKVVANLEAAIASLPGLEIAGNALHGVGVPQCVRSGEAAVDRMLSDLQRGDAAL